MKRSTRILAATVIAATLGLSGQSGASTFAAWEVTDVPWGDTLNVRKYPASHSQKQTAYPNGTVLQMTGRCTGGVNLFEIADLAHWQQKQTVRYRWCEIWHDPARDGDFVTGWAYGKFLRPAQ